MELIGRIILLAPLRDKDARWKEIGIPVRTERPRRYLSFDLVNEDDKRKPLQFGIVKPGRDLTGWFKPEYDDCGVALLIFDGEWKMEFCNGQA